MLIIILQRFSQNINLAIEMRKTQIFINKPVYLGFSMLYVSKTVTYTFWYGYVKLKYGENPKIWFMDTDSFIVHIKTDDIYKSIVKDVEIEIDTSNY